ncbi:MAG: FixH family protein [Planctomycetota bacterium]
MQETTTQQRQEKFAQLIWTGGILGFFMIQAIIWTVAITLTANDKSHAVVADYDSRALNWDEEIARRDASARLGWVAQIHIDSTGNLRGERNLTVELVNREGHAIENAKLEVNTFHKAMAAVPQTMTFKEINPGVYATTIVVRKPGNWQFAGTASNDESTFLIEETRWLEHPTTTPNRQRANDQQREAGN